MGEEDIETAKSEFRQGIEYLFCTALIYRQMRKGQCNLGVSWPGQQEQGSLYLVQTLLQCLLPHAHDLIHVHIAACYIPLPDWNDIVNMQYNLE